MSAKKLTLAQAADQWEAATREMARQKGLLAEAAPVLMAHFDRTGRDTYRGRIRRKRSGGGMVLDAAKLKEHFGAKIADFQKRRADGWTLELLEKR